MIQYFILPIFEKNISNIMLDSPNLGAAALFYIFYVAGVIWIAAIPFLKGDTSLLYAISTAFIIGLLSYGTYEFTNYAILKGWTLQMVIIDTIWGGVLTATSLFIGFNFTQFVYRIL
jgi:uncharacterized membrane protein